MSSAQISREGLLNMVQGGDGKTESYIEEKASPEGTEYIVHFVRGTGGKGLLFTLSVSKRELAESLLNGWNGVIDE